MERVLPAKSKTCTGSYKHGLRRYTGNLCLAYPPVTNLLTGVCKGGGDLCANILTLGPKGGSDPPCNKITTGQITQEGG